MKNYDNDDLLKEFDQKIFESTLSIDTNISENVLKSIEKVKNFVNKIILKDDIMGIKDKQGALDVIELYSEIVDKENFSSQKLGSTFLKGGIERDKSANILTNNLKGKNCKKVVPPYVRIELAATGNKDFLKEFIEKEDDISEESITLHISKQDNEDLIKLSRVLIKRIEENHLKNDMFVCYSNIAENGDLAFALKGANKLEKNNQIFEAGYVYIKLVEKGYKKGVKKIQDLAKILFDGGSYLHAGYLYLNLIKLGDQSASIALINCANKLKKDGNLLTAGYIFAALGNIGNEIAVKNSKECIKELIKEGKIMDTTMIMSYLLKVPNGVSVKEVCENIDSINNLQIDLKLKIAFVFKYLNILSKQGLPEINDYIIGYSNGLHKIGFYELGGVLGLELYKRGDERGLKIYSINLFKAFMSDDNHDGIKLLEALGKIGNDKIINDLIETSYFVNMAGNTTGYLAIMSKIAKMKVLNQLSEKRGM